MIALSLNPSITLIQQEGWSPGSLPETCVWLLTGPLSCRAGWAMSAAEESCSRWLWHPGDSMSCVSRLMALRFFLPLLCFLRLFGMNALFKQSTQPWLMLITSETILCVMKQVQIVSCPFSEMYASLLYFLTMCVFHFFLIILTTLFTARTFERSVGITNGLSGGVFGIAYFFFFFRFIFPSAFTSRCHRSVIS